MGTTRKKKSAKLSQYGVAENGWPLVPCNPDAIPPGYEAVRVDWPNAQELFITKYNQRTSSRYGLHADDMPPTIIIQEWKDPISLPVTIVPPGWWLVKRSNGQCVIFEKEPSIWKFYGSWTGEDEGYFLAPPVVKQLPKEWLKLPWEKSKVQQKEK